MDLVEEKDGPMAAVLETCPGIGQDAANLLHADHGGIGLFEVTAGLAGNDMRKRRLAGPWRSPEDRTGKPVGIEHPAE